MKDFIMFSKMVFSMIGAFIGSLFGEVDGLLYALLFFIFIDYLSGIFAAVVERNLSSSIGFQGIFKKISLLFLVAVANLIDTRILKQGGAIRTMVVFFYLSNEGLSILENTIRIGLPVPKKLQVILKQLNQEEDKDGDKK